MQNSESLSSLYMSLLAVGAFLISFFGCMLLIFLAKKYSWYDIVNPRKMHKGSVPRLGGIAVMFSVSACALWTFRLAPFEKGLEYLPVLFGAIFIFLSCVVDDFISIRARYKFLIQIVAATLAAFSPLSFGNILSLSIPDWFDFFCVFFWVLLLVNAYNMIDGIDWLCSGLSFFAVTFFAIVYYQTGSNLYIHMIPLGAAILGFMFWNKPDAKIFLGDCGSEVLGYFIAVIPLFNTGYKPFEINKLLLCLIICSIPTIDVLAAVWRRLRDGQSIFCADRKHIHHKLINIGFSKISVLVFLLGLQLFISIVAYIALFINHVPAFTLLCVTYAFIIMIFASIHYINRSVNKRMRGILQNLDKK